MTIQNISSNNTVTNQLGNTQSSAVIQPITQIKTQPNNEFLTPEQQNTLQDNFNDKIIAQAEDIKANFQTAKDIDLTRAYYEQQQKLIDIYTQSGSESNESTSVTKALAETYSSLYQLHQSIKEGGQELPSIGEPVQLPSIDEPAQLPANGLPSLMSKEAALYNNLMMPSTSSYIHMQA